MDTSKSIKQQILEEDSYDDDGLTLVVSASPPAPALPMADRVGEEVVRTKQTTLAKQGAAASTSGTRVNPTLPASRSVGASITTQRQGYTTFKREGTHKVKKILYAPQWMKDWHDTMGSLPDPVIADWYKRAMQFVPDQAYIDTGQRRQRE